MLFIKNLLSLLAILMLIVCVHEGGHFVAAKIFNVYCHEFSFGMGPLIWKHKFKETQLSLRALPIGGFVKMAGEPDSKVETKYADEGIPRERTLVGVSKWKQIIITYAGIFMNFVLAFVLMIVAFSTYKIADPIVINSSNPLIETGDVIISVNGENFLSPSELDKNIEKGILTVEVERGEEILNINLSPVNEKTYGLDFKVTHLDFKSSVAASWGYCREVSSLIFNTLKTLFVDEGYKNVGGVISMYNMVSDLKDLVEILAITAMLSINVGIVNALPLPIMDGGRALIILIECVTRKKLSEKAENWAYGISFFLLIGIFFFVMYLDILRVLGKL